MMTNANDSNQLSIWNEMKMKESNVMKKWHNGNEKLKP